MAQLLCISTRSKKTTNNLGDVVGVFDDTHVFSDKERDLFDIVNVENSLVEAATPEVRMIFLDPADGVWKVHSGTPYPFRLNYNAQNKTLGHTLKGTALSETDAGIKADKQKKIDKAAAE